MGSLISELPNMATIRQIDYGREGSSLLALQGRVKVLCPVFVELLLQLSVLLSLFLGLLHVAVCFL